MEKKNKTTKPLKDKEDIQKSEIKKEENDQPSNSFWSKIGKFVKDAVDCCLE
ncbi:MAG TPA: hypothetical protein PLL26_03595 [Candidatus Dojkabacteria bacterium]|nr:hypothetical protein [Candidatus Dojkabacteria bacterium]